MEKKLKNDIGSYNKSKLVIDEYKDRIAYAVERSKKLDVNATYRWPKNPGTHVYRVIEEINKLL